MLPHKMEQVYSKSFKVSVCVEGQCYHLRLSITKEDGGSMYDLEGALGRFNDVFKMLEFYETNPVSSTFDIIGTCLNVPRRRATDPHLSQGIDEKPLLAKSHSHAYMNQASYVDNLKPIYSALSTRHKWWFDF